MTRQSMYKYTQGIYTYDFRIKNVRFVFTSSCLQTGRMSYLRYMCLVTHSGVQHLVLCFFVFLRLCTRCCQFLWIAHCWFSNVYITQSSSSRNNMKNTSVIMGEIMAARNNSGAIVLVMTSCFDPIYESRQRLSHFYFLLLRYWSIQ